VRLVVILALALSLNIGLFLLMDNMVGRESVRVVDLMDVQPIEFIRTPIEEETRTRDRRSSPPPKPREIDRPQAQVTDIAQRATALNNFSQDYEIEGLLGESGGIALGQGLVGSNDNDFSDLMANDLVPVSMLPPQYPPSARQRNIEGWVDVIFVVSTSGSVEQAWVVEADPAAVFDQAAIDAALRWRFRPVTEAGEPVSVERIIRINFSLD